MSTYQILSLCGVTSLVGLLIEFLIRRPLSKRMAKAEAEQVTQRAQNAATMLGVQALLRDRLLQAYKHYMIQGWANYDEKQNVDNMHTQYEALGPNNVMIGYHERFMNLPDQPHATGEGGHAV
jgi:hypothetical protein